MPRKERGTRFRDLSRIRSVRSGTSKHASGTPRSGIVPAFRSEIVSGEAVLVTRSGRRVDLRTFAGRRFRALVTAIVEDLGGPQNVSTAELQLVRRAAAIAIDLEYQEAEALDKNQPLDPNIFRTMAETQRRIFQTLGLRRRARDITPNPLEYGHTLEAEAAR